jgi:hypothetical protein
VRTELGRSLPLLVLFVIGLAAGVWIFASPWVLGYPTPAGWTPSVWTSVWAGGGVAGVSAVSLVTLLARAVHVSLRQRSTGEEP